MKIKDIRVVQDQVSLNEEVHKSRGNQITNRSSTKKNIEIRGDKMRTPELYFLILMAYIHGERRIR